MTSILRVKAKWTGFSGAPGYTVLHFRDFGTGTGPGADPTAAQAIAAAGRVRSFFNALVGVLPNSVRVNIEPEVELIEDTTGELINTFPAGTQLEVVGTGGAEFAGATGAVINWRTNAVRNGRRIRGRSFIVPLRLASFGTNGTIGAASLATLQTAATQLAATDSSPDLGVYARPTSAGASDGVWTVVSSASVPALAAVLRSRRD